MTILITLRRPGHPTRRWVGIYPGTSAAIVATLERLDQEGATGANHISAQVLA